MMMINCQFIVIATSTSGNDEIMNSTATNLLWPWWSLTREMMASSKNGNALAPEQKQ